MRSTIQEIYFDEPRLRMTAAGRFFIRLISTTAYGFTAAAALIFSFSDVRPLRATGILLALFVFDRIIHIGKPDKSLARVTGGRVNAASYFAPAGFRVLESAYDKAHFGGGRFFLRLFKILIARREIQIGLERMDAPIKDLSVKLEEFLNQNPSAAGLEDLNKEIAFLAERAFAHAFKTHSPAVEPKDLFAALVSVKDAEITKLLNLFQINGDDLENALIFNQFNPGFFRGRHLTGFISKPFKVRHRVMNRAWTAKPTPFLDRFSEDLTDLARSGAMGFLIGHEKEYNELVDVLARPGNPNAFLVGESGSGKSAIVGRLAFQIIKDRVPSPLFDKRLVALSLGSIAAGAEEGELRERIQRAMSELIRAGNIILYIPDIHNLVRTGAFQMSAADILLPIIKSSAVSVVGSTYPKEFKQYIEPNTEFAGAFQTIRVNEISEEEAVKFLTYESAILESRYNIVVSLKAVKRAAAIAHKYFRQKLLPGSASDLLEEALADAVQSRKKVLTEADLISIAERRVNVPMHEVEAGEASKLLDLEKVIHERLIGQDEAVKAVAEAMREYRSGLSRKGGPIASFLFVGPTGVGKTELAKTLAKIQFGSDGLMLRFDMSEYQDKQSFFRFIGSPDGSVRGALTDVVLEKPYSLILLDEFEKAHPDILNLFLQVFDDGRLTDNLGRTVDFQNTIIIATSNAHSEFIKTEIEKNTSVKEISEQLKRKLTDFFRAELLNRFSGIIVFKPLTPADIGVVAKNQLSDLAEILKDNQGIDLQFDEALVKKIAEWGFDPVFGARPLRRVISEKLRAALAEKILKGEVKRGSSVKAVLEGEAINFENK
ncbi:MAG TPA: ATP-dependent Clp protease ATP-binding subunit [Candidatus Paceibacterota bacterium]